LCPTDPQVLMKVQEKADAKLAEEPSKESNKAS
jgi:hypothetical protein